MPSTEGLHPALPRGCREHCRETWGTQTLAVPRLPPGPEGSAQDKRCFWSAEGCRSSLPPVPFVAEAPQAPWLLLGLYHSTAPAVCSPRRFQLLFPPGSLCPSHSCPSSLKTEGFPTRVGWGAPGELGFLLVARLGPDGCPVEGWWLGPCISTVFKVSQPCLLAESWNLQLQLC